MESVITHFMFSSPLLSAVIRGAVNVATTILMTTLAPGEACAHEWKGRGLRVHVRANALESDTPSVLRIQASSRH